MHPLTATIALSLANAMVFLAEGNQLETELHKLINHTLSYPSEEFLRTVANAAPPCANHFEAQLEAAVAQAWGERMTTSRRQLQLLPILAPAELYISENNELIHLLYPNCHGLHCDQLALCHDPLAANAEQPGTCTYDCQSLQAHYFPQVASRCFLYDAAVGQWLADLLQRVRTRLDAHTYYDAVLSNPITDTVRFTIGEGRACSNVTFLTNPFSSEPIPRYDSRKTLERGCMHEISFQPP
jgi:hypothetical protein